MLQGFLRSQRASLGSMTQVFSKTLSTAVNRRTTSYVDKIVRVNRFHSTSEFKNVPKKPSVLFFGTDTFAVNCLKPLVANSKNLSRIEIVCPGDRKMGRGMKLSPLPMKQYAIDNNIKYHEFPVEGFKNWTVPTYTTKKDETNSNAQSSISDIVNQFDIMVVVSFGYYVPSKIVKQFSAAVNVHPSLLPKYRGAAPIHHCLLNGDTVTGVSVIELSVKTMDAGNIIYSEAMDVKPGIQYPELYFDLSLLGGKCLKLAVQNINSFRKKGLEQSSTGITQASKVHKKLMAVDWRQETGVSISRKSNALSYQFPFVTYLGKNRVFLRNFRGVVAHVNTSGDVVPGLVVISSSLVSVRCQDAWVTFQEVSVDNGPIISPKAFNGKYLKKIRQTVFKPVATV